MVVFALNPSEIQNGYNNAAVNPYVSERDSAPSFYKGALTAIPTGFQQGGAEIGEFLSGGSKHSQEVVKSLTPDPMTSGWLANVMQGVSSIVPSMLAGTALSGGNPVGGALAIGETKGFSAMKEKQAEGIDEATAAKVGVIEGITQGAGVLFPAAVGGKALTRVATGAGINVGIGGASRGATGKILEANGYKEMADQYRVIDGMAMMTDAIIGGAFGGLHIEGKAEPLPSEIDAGLAANNIHQLEIESAPGIPVDIATRNAHIEAMDIATEQVLRGEPVDVTNELNNTNFIHKPIDSERISNISDSLSESGYGEIVHANEKMREYAGRIDELTNDIRSAQSAIDQASNLEGQTAYLDPETATRIREINRELENSNLPIRRREELQGEKTMLTEGAAAFPENQVGMLEALSASDKSKMRSLEIKKQKLQKRLNESQSKLRRVISNLSDFDRVEYASLLEPESRPVRVVQVKKAESLPDKDNSKQVEANIADKESNIPHISKEIISEKPDLKITDESGNVMAAGEALARADEDVAQAEKDSSLFEAAINCFIRNGDA